MPLTKTLKLGDREVARIGLGTNRLSRSSRNVTFIQQAARGRGRSHRHRASVHRRRERDDARRGRRVPAGEARRCDEGRLQPGTGPAGGAARPDRGEPSPAAHRDDRLYYLHRVDPETPMEESLGTIAEYVERGAIRHVGISEVGVEQIEQASAVVDDRRGAEPLQPRRARARRRRRPLRRARGSSSSRSFRCAASAAARSSGSPTTAGRRRHQIALAWLLKRSPVMLPIPGTLSIEHLKENLARARDRSDATTNSRASADRLAGISQYDLSW